MDPTFWIAHVLALHLNVPEPVEFRFKNLWPSENKAQIEMRSGKWVIEYNFQDWDRDSKEVKEYTIAHELCHTVHEYNTPPWGDMTKKERNKRHKFVDECARKIIRDHKDCG